MRLKQSLLLGLAVLVAPLGCERNRTVKTIPAPPPPPPAEARAEPVLEEDLNNNLPTERPSEETEDNTGVDGDRPAPAVEAGPEQPPTMPPR